MSWTFRNFMENLADQAEYRASCIEAAAEWSRSRGFKASTRAVPDRDCRSREVLMYLARGGERNRKLLLQAYENKSELELARRVEFGIGQGLTTFGEAPPARAGEGTFSGRAMSWGFNESKGYYIEPGAFKNLGDDFLKAGWVGLYHDLTKLAVGYPVDATEDRQGLIVTARFHNTRMGQDSRTVVKERLAAGKSVPWSIGFVARPDGEHYETRNGQPIRVVSAADLYEVSLVNFGADPTAQISWAV